MIDVTERAILEIKKIQTSETNGPDSHLRVKVVGGGCSGMSYKLDFESTPATEADETFRFGDIKVVVDKKSLLFIKGTTLDFSGGLNGKGFEFTNPNAKRTCGCGSSFST